jgi:hypothetical protein
MSGRHTAWLLAGVLILPLAAGGEEAPPNWVTEARQGAAELGRKLVSTLQQSIQAEGPVAAVAFCRLQAPEIADQVSTAHAMQVGRTALRVRNPDNQPDAWEQRMLELMQARLAAGEPASQIEVFAVHNDNGARSGRWMRAIPMQPLCLNCHGSNIATPVAAAIDASYPQDQARDFEVGELRGAFTVTVPLHD